MTALVATLLSFLLAGEAQAQEYYGVPPIENHEDLLDFLALNPLGASSAKAIDDYLDELEPGDLQYLLNVIWERDLLDAFLEARPLDREDPPVTRTVTVDVFDDDFDEVIEVEVKPTKKKEDGSNAYNHHFTWTGGRVGVDFATPYTMTADDVFSSSTTHSWGGNPNDANVGGAEVTDGKNGTAKKPILAYDNFSASIAGDFRRVGDSVVMIGDENTHLRFVGYEAKSFVGAEVNKTGVKASASVSLNTYLARARSYESFDVYKGETFGFALKEYTEANIGANGGLGSTLTVGRSGVELGGEAKAFAGADASGWVGGGVSLCKVKVDLRGKGSVSAGLGGKLTGTAKAHWSSGKFELGGGIAATLGLGAGTGVNVWIDAQSLVKTPGVVVDCFGDKIEDLGELTRMMGVAHGTRDALQSGYGVAERLVVDQIGSAFVSSFNSIKGLFGGCPLNGGCN